MYSEVNEEMSKLLTYEFFKKLNKSELKKYALAACIKAQLEGITIGYNKIANAKLSIEDFYYMNSQGNFNDLRRFLKMRNTNKSKKENFFTEENLKKVNKF
jgi:ATP-dependent helicase/DNAse subunit B